jgi:hypothetical protein
LGHDPGVVPVGALLVLCTVSHAMFVQLQMSRTSMRLLVGVGNWLLGRLLIWTPVSWFISD